MSFASGSFVVGHPRPFKLVTERRGFGIYRLHPEAGADSYVIAKMPTKRVTEFVPSTAIEPFTNLESAEEALNRWSSDPTPPRSPGKPKAAPGSYRRNGHRPKFRGDGAGQMFLNLKSQKQESRAHAGSALKLQFPNEKL